MRKVLCSIVCAIVLFASGSAYAQAPVQAQDVLPSMTVEQQLIQINARLVNLQADIEALRQQDATDHAAIIADTHTLADTAKSIGKVVLKYGVPAVLGLYAGHKMAK